MEKIDFNNWCCPLPVLDFDTITLGHGSGGQLTHQLLENGIFSAFGEALLDSQHDGAVLDFQGKMAFTTDSFVVSPVFFPESNIGELAVNGTINDLAMCGAMPRYLSMSLILEEGLPVAELWEILKRIKFSCLQAGVYIVTGDTKVVERGKGDKIFVNTTGLGEVHPRANISAANVREGDKILVSGNIAAHGMAIMSVREGLEFESTIKSDTAALHEPVRRLLDKFGDRIRWMRDPTRGGVATVLNELAQQCKKGISISQNAIPVDEEVQSACEILGLDPLYVANEGVFIAVADASIAEEALEELQKEELAQNACLLGEVCAQHPGQVVLRSSIGGRRVVGMLPGEQLPRIC